MLFWNTSGTTAAFLKPLNRCYSGTRFASLIKLKLRQIPATFGKNPSYFEPTHLVVYFI